MRFIFFTKTNWAEPPRLRHQLAQLLADAGHEVLFFECPVFPWQKTTCAKSEHPRIRLFRYRQGIHHKLRLNSTLHKSNAIFEKCQISKVLTDIDFSISDVIVNFNYDYFFLRSLFPHSRLITIINDNFWSSAIGGYEKPLKWALERTCRSSSAVLTVSEPLVRQLENYCIPKLFYPWADIPYKTPLLNTKRSALLYWGYIGDRLDYGYLRKLAHSIRKYNPLIRIRFVGPIEAENGDFLNLVQNYGIEYCPACRINELFLDDVFAALIPYRSNIPCIEAITLPNKALQLLCRGIPLLISGMPHFVESNVVFRLDESGINDLEKIEYVLNNFDQLQPKITHFLAGHSSEERLQRFMEIVNQNAE